MNTLEQLIDTDKEIIIFGAGNMGRLVLRYLSSYHCNVVLMVDNSKQKWGKKINKMRICSPKDGKTRYPGAIYVIANVCYGHDIERQLLQMGILRDDIILCDNERMLLEQIEKKHKMIYEDKNFIYDIPEKKCLKNRIIFIGMKIKAGVYFSLMNIIYPDKRKVRKKFYVSICAIFKNEAPYLEEWIEYHMIIGVEHFYLYNNFSDDFYKEVLQYYVDKEIVTLIDWPYEQGQMSAYKDCVRRFSRETQWIGFIDLDEFVVPIDNDNLYDFLKPFEKNRGSVIIYWKFFGSAGKRERDISKLIIEDFTVCWRKHVNIGKCFFNTSYDFIPEYAKNGMMHHKMWTGCKGLIFPPANCFGRICFGKLNLTKGDHFPIQINHYFTKSYEEWLAKEKKGDVYHKKNPHNEQYFFLHDMKCGSTDKSIYKYLLKLKLNLCKKRELY